MLIFSHCSAPINYQSTSATSELPNCYCAIRIGMIGGMDSSEVNSLPIGVNSIFEINYPLQHYKMKLSYILSTIILMYMCISGKQFFICNSNCPDHNYKAVHCGILK